MRFNFVDTAKGVVVDFVTTEKKEETGFSGKLGETRVLYGETNKILMGVDLFDVTTEYVNEFKGAIVAVASEVIKLKSDEVTFKFPAADIGDEFTTTLIKAAVEALVISDSPFEAHKSKKSEKILNVNFVNDDVDIEEAITIASAVVTAKNLVDENASIVTPAYFERTILGIADTDADVTVEVISGDDLAKRGLNLFHAVGKGSQNKPKLIIAKYTGVVEEEAVPYRAVIGKGITFDSGGLNLKPGNSILDMRTDMAGAAAVLGAFQATVELKPEENIIFAFACAENSISDKAYYPGDVYKGYSGKTVEIANTDAEGRLVLADTISYVIDKYDVEEIVDIATLTGACVAALGTEVAALFSNTKDLAEDLYMSGERSGDRVWELPIRKDHVKDVKGTRGDLRNTGKRAGKAGAITAAAFLQEFAGDVAWAHIDIAGTARGEAATGFGAALLIDYITY